MQVFHPEVSAAAADLAADHVREESAAAPRAARELVPSARKRQKLRFDARSQKPQVQASRPFWRVLLQTVIRNLKRFCILTRGGGASAETRNNVENDANMWKLLFRLL